MQDKLRKVGEHTSEEAGDPGVVGSTLESDEFARDEIESGRPRRPSAASSAKRAIPSRRSTARVYARSQNSQSWAFHDGVTGLGAKPRKRGAYASTSLGQYTKAIGTSRARSR